LGLLVAVAPLHAAQANTSAPTDAAVEARRAKKAARKATQTDPATKPAAAARKNAPSPMTCGYRDFDAKALQLAIEDLAKTFPDRYPRGREFLSRLAPLAKAFESETKQPAPDKMKLADLTRQFEALKTEALLANPLLSFERLLLVRRSVSGNAKASLGLPQNWQGNCALPRSGFDNEIAVLSPVRPEGKLRSFHAPANPVFVGDVDLNFDADKLLFSSIGPSNRWHVFEIDAQGKNLRQLTPNEPEVDWYDACYLPDGRIICAATAVFHGVPCVGGKNTVANLFLLTPDGRQIRQLCFDQDHNWCPTVLNDGRVLYSRWEYSDTPHFFTRLLFHMNPDGTGQMEHYGSSSYWPNSIFYARPVPDHPSQLVAVISGHHGVPRMGELVVFDPAKGRHEAAGAVQRIPGYAQPVEPVILDQLVRTSWPKFLHPYPLSSKYFLVSMQLRPESSWGIYLVDMFDNYVLVHEQAGQALLEPVPFRATTHPPVIPDKVNPESREAVVYLSDIYSGGGLRGVPRGTVKKLRIYEPHYAYPKMGGHISIGVDGPWDVHRIVGTVPVNEDGSVNFKVPANTPLAVQPLDEEGRALQLLRSWFTAMPGEVLSCTGCHESQNSTPLRSLTLASQKPPVEITPWYGPARGFSFKREVQPVLDRYCVGCHNGQPTAEGKKIADLSGKGAGSFRNFTPSYLALHPYVRRPGPESDYHLQVPMEWGANTSELIQMLKKGHYRVNLDEEAWDRLYTWIDLNVPDHGTWSETKAIAGDYRNLRLAMRTKYANRPEDPELIPAVSRTPVSFVKPSPLAERKEARLQTGGWPFDATEAKRRQTATSLPPTMKVDLTSSVQLELALIPAGSFIMGDVKGCEDEHPQAMVKIEKPFYLGRCEVTVEQFAQFDPSHDNGYISVFNKDQNTRGEVANRLQQPVIRVSWEEAMKFCEWLTIKTGRKFSLPTEAQWEYACRAGTDTALHYGAAAVDFGRFANLADRSVLALCRRDSPKWIPAVATVNDGATVTADVGKYQPNSWGIHDMHGNVSEWTLTTYKPYPYDPTDGRDAGLADGPKVVRGGSFYDRPERARSAFRLSYPAWQRVFNVGFRVVSEVPASVTTRTQTAAR